MDPRLKLPRGFTKDHPAPFSDEVLLALAPLLTRYKIREALDPMAGVGKLALVKRLGFEGRIVLNELQPHWAVKGHVLGADEVYADDAAVLGWAQGRKFDAVACSPDYGTRMADHHDAKDASERITYQHKHLSAYGEGLDPRSTCRLQWGPAYRELHTRILTNVVSRVKRRGLLFYNVSDHIRKGERQPVSAWFRDQLIELGCTPIETVEVPTPRMRKGQNHELRVESEQIHIFRL